MKNYLLFIIFNNNNTNKKGGFMSLFSRWFGSKERRILILGLDGAGKTTILYRLQVGEVVTTIPSNYQFSLNNNSIINLINFTPTKKKSNWFQC